MFSILELVGRLVPAIDIVDVGAMWFGQEHLAYKGLLKKGLGRVVGFEPVQAECDKLNALGMAGHRYLPYFIGDGTERTFYLTNQSMTASLYEPNTALLAKFHNIEELTRTVETCKVQTRRMDDLAELAAIDFLKADVQGAELDVFKGATRLLQGTVVVETEVEFAPMYKGQPLFADVDAFLRSQGFAFHTFSSTSAVMFKPLVVRGDPTATLRQQLWANAVYVKDYMALSGLSPEQLLKYAVIMHEVYQSYDLAGVALAEYDAKTKAGIGPVYLKRVAGHSIAARR